MSKRPVKILGIRIDNVTLEEAYTRFLSFMESGSCKMIFTPNTEIVMAAQEDAELKNILFDADLVVPDGIGLVYASKIHNLGLTERVTGIDTMERILKYANNTKKSIYILGGKPGVVEKAAENIKDAFPSLVIAGVRDGFFKVEDEQKIVDQINELKPDILFVALGAPKQEKWIYKYRKILNTKVAMGVGGSVDVWAGTVKRAPKIFQDLHLEWFYRLCKDPSRIGRMMALPQFMIRVVLSKDFSKEI